jgi:hypothetical protein
MAAINTGSARAYYGLQATAEPTSEGTAGTLTIGHASTSASLPDSTHAIVLAVEVDSTYTVELDGQTLIPTLTGAGVAQVETATAAGTIGTSGNATVVVTGDDITGSPLTVSVAVTSGDTAATWAGKVRTALGLVSAITNKYTVGGSTTAITLTRTSPRYNDSTLNISLDNGTCTGITTAATSANTTAGINPAKCWRIDGTTYAGDDFEGITLQQANDYQGFSVRSTSGAMEVATAKFQDEIAAGEVVQKSTTGVALASIESSGNITFTGISAYGKAIVTLLFN